MCYRRMPPLRGDARLSAAVLLARFLKLLRVFRAGLRRMCSPCRRWWLGAQVGGLIYLCPLVPEGYFLGPGLSSWPLRSSSMPLVPSTASSCRRSFSSACLIAARICDSVTMVFSLWVCWGGGVSRRCPPRWGGRSSSRAGLDDCVALIACVVSCRVTVPCGLLFVAVWAIHGCLGCCLLNRLPRSVARVGGLNKGRF